MRLRSLALPTPDEVRRELPALLVASGELIPRPLAGDPSGRPRTLSVNAWLSAAFGNADFEPDLAAFSELERAFIERQIERTARDEAREPVRAPNARWRLHELSVASLADDWDSRSDGLDVLFVEVPVFTTDRLRVCLRGQRHGMEDFAHWLQKKDGRWTST